VAVAFALSHSRPDWIAAFVVGVLYNVVAYRSRSLALCILAHATTNLLLGLWIIQTATRASGEMTVPLLGDAYDTRSKCNETALLLFLWHFTCS